MNSAIRRMLMFSLFAGAMPAIRATEPFVLDSTSKEQADREKKALAAGMKHDLSPAMAEYRKTAKEVEYPSGELKLPGWLYTPKGEGPFPAVLWNHGSEKNPIAHPELARFYSEHGYAFFVPVRRGHGHAPGDYIVDRQKKLFETEKDSDVVRRKIVELHDIYNEDVAAAVEWLKKQPKIDNHRLIVSGVSYGGIQTLLAAEKGLGVRGFVPFAPGAMSFANSALRERMKKAAANAKAPIFLLQAKNDYSIGPSELLGPVLKERGVPSGNKVYDDFGTTNQHGHGAFACWSLGTLQWGDDVLKFMDACLKAKP